MIEPQSHHLGGWGGLGCGQGHHGARLTARQLSASKAATQVAHRLLYRRLKHRLARLPEIASSFKVRDLLPQLRPRLRQSKL